MTAAALVAEIAAAGRRREGEVDAARYRSEAPAERYRQEAALCNEMHKLYAQCKYCLNRCRMVADKFYISDHRSEFCGVYTYPKQKPEGVCEGNENCRFFERDLRV